MPQEPTPPRDDAHGEPQDERKQEKPFAGFLRHFEAFLQRHGARLIKDSPENLNLPMQEDVFMTPEQHQREARIAETLRAEREARMEAGVKSAMDDVRHNVVERPWYGREVTDTIDRPIVTIHGNAAGQEAGGIHGQAGQQTIHGAGIDQGGGGSPQGTGQSGGQDIHGNAPGQAGGVHGQTKEEFLEAYRQSAQQPQGNVHGKAQGQGMEP